MVSSLSSQARARRVLLARLQELVPGRDDKKVGGMMLRQQRKVIAFSTQRRTHGRPRDDDADKAVSKYGGHDYGTAIAAIGGSQGTLPPSRLVARCDAAEGQLPRNASGMRGSRGHTSVSVTLRDTQKKHTQDGEDKGKVDVRSRLAGELWGRLSGGGVGALKSHSRGLRDGGHVHVVFLDEL